MSTIAKNNSHVWSGAAENISGKNIKPTDNVCWFQKNTERLPQTGSGMPALNQDETINSVYINVEKKLP